MMVDDAAIFQMLRQVGADGGMVALHAENGTVIELLIKEALAAGPHLAALPRADATGADGRRGDAPRHPAGGARRRRRSTSCMCPRSEALEHIVEARAAGIPVFAETCPHYLLFDDSVYDSDDFEKSRST